MTESSQKATVELWRKHFTELLAVDGKERDSGFGWGVTAKRREVGFGEKC